MIGLGSDCDLCQTRIYWLVTHEDTRGLGRSRDRADHLARAVARDRAMFL